MFDYCGTKLKNLAVFFFVVGVLGAFVILLMPFITDTAEYTFFPALLGAAVDIFLSYVGTLVLYTIGETWENTVYQQSANRPSIIRPAASSAKKPVSNTASAGAPLPNGAWTCSCGHVNSAVKTACSRCGKEKE